MKLQLATLLADFRAKPVVEVALPDELKKKLMFSIRNEGDQIRSDLDFQYSKFSSDQCYRGLMRHHSCNGDAYRFHESSPMGRLEYAAQSGLLCNLEDEFYND